MGLKKIVKSAAIIGLGIVGTNGFIYGLHTITYHHIANKGKETAAKTLARVDLEDAQKIQNSLPVIGKTFTYGMEKAAEHWLKK